MKSHIPTNRCSHKDSQSGRREDRLCSSSRTSMKLEHNTKTFITLMSSRQLCRLYVLKWPLPFLSSPITLLPTATKGPRDRFTITPHCPVTALCLPSDHERCRCASPLHQLPLVTCSRSIPDCSHPWVSSHWFPMGWTQQPPPRQDFLSEFL